MVVFGVVAVLVRELAELGSLSPQAGRGSARQLHAEPSGHAEVHREHLAAVEMDEDVLGAALQPLDRAARKTLDEALRQRKAQIRPALFDVDKSAPAQHGLEACAHRLDLGELRHRRLRLPGRPSTPQPGCPPPPPPRRCRRCRRRCPPRRSAPRRHRG